jgi:hypothetical protein
MIGGPVHIFQDVSVISLGAERERINKALDKSSFAEVATLRQRLFIWLLDRIRCASGLRRPLPRLSGRRHNSCGSAI